MIRCPVHDMPDCSPLLNGCTLVNKLHAIDEATTRLRELIEEMALATGALHEAKGDLALIRNFADAGVKKL
jgi:hypothetical protein